MSTLTAELLDAANSVGDAGLRPAREMAAHCLLDWLGVALAGSGDPLVDTLAADALISSGAGRWPLLGRAEQVGLRDFVLVNGVAGHALDYDDGLPPMLGHPSAPIIPALLATAASRGCTGAALIDAMVTAVEMAARVGLLLTPAHYDRGFHATGTVGAVAAAAGCARLMQLDPERATTAVGLAGTRAAGLKASFGSGGKPLNAGWAALTGFTAACWAERGFTGAGDILGDKSGMTALLGVANREAALARAAGGAHILRVKFKRFAACAGTHSAIEAALTLRAAHELVPETVRQATVTVHPRLDQVCNIAAPDTGLEGKFSLRATVAMALAGVDLAAPASFSDELMRSPSHRALRERVAVEFAPDLGSSRATLRIETVDGRVLEAAPAEHPDGMSDEVHRTLLNKFRALADPVVTPGEAERLAAAALEMVEAEDVRVLLGSEDAIERVI